MFISALYRKYALTLLTVPAPPFRRQNRSQSIRWAPVKFWHPFHNRQKGAETFTSLLFSLLLDFYPLPRALFRAGEAGLGEWLSFCQPFQSLPRRCVRAVMRLPPAARAAPVHNADNAFFFQARPKLNILFTWIF